MMKEGSAISRMHFPDGYCNSIAERVGSWLKAGWRKSRNSNRGNLVARVLPRKLPFSCKK
jgi:hypothetical protein